MAAVVTTVKTALFIKKYWKQILAAGFAIVFLVLMFPIASIVFFPSAKPAAVDDYKKVALRDGLDWAEMLVYDTVRYNNDFSKSVPSKTSFSFYKVFYKVYKKQEEFTYTVEDHYVDTADGTVNEPVRIPHVSYEWVLSSSGTSNGYDSISSLLTSFGYTGEMKFSDISSFLKGLPKGQAADTTYDVQINKITLEELADSLDQDHRQWIFNLISSIQYLYGGIEKETEYYLPPGVHPFVFPSPFAKTVTSPFGYRIHPITKVTTFHYGIDLASDDCYGTSVVSVADGVVTDVNNSPDGLVGRYIKISHTVSGDVWQSRYLHLSRIFVKTGQRVDQGQVIGEIGNSGQLTTGPHLHFELYYKGGIVDPQQYIFY